MAECKLMIVLQITKLVQDIAGLRTQVHPVAHVSPITATINIPTYPYTSMRSPRELGSNDPGKHFFSYSIKLRTCYMVDGSSKGCQSGASRKEVLKLELSETKCLESGPRQTMLAKPYSALSQQSRC
jgi:hypothetical protein